MRLSAKKVVSNFYNSDLLKDEIVLETFFHPEMTLIWNNSEGLTIMNYDDIISFFSEIRKTYKELRSEISHVLQDKNFVTIRYKYYVKTLENPEEELGVAHFIAIWEVKDNKLYQGYQVSQPVMGNDETEKSYHRVKV